MYTTNLKLRKQNTKSNHTTHLKNIDELVCVGIRLFRYLFKTEEGYGSKFVVCSFYGNNVFSRHHVVA